MITIFDTETTGVPKNYNGDPRDLENWPRVIQLAFVRFSEEGEIEDKQCTLIKPDGWVVPDGEFWQKHGFSQWQNEADGIPMQEALDMFVDSLNKSSVIVAHNFKFDYPIMVAEMLRYEKKAEKKEREKICTMVSTTDLVRLPGKRGFKWPKLEELHDYLFGKGFEGAHDALNDVIACGNCYFELKKRGVKLWS